VEDERRAEVGADARGSQRPTEDSGPVGVGPFPGGRPAWPDDPRLDDFREFSLRAGFFSVHSHSIQKLKKDRSPYRHLYHSLH